MFKVGKFLVIMLCILSMLFVVAGCVPPPTDESSQSTEDGQVMEPVELRLAHLFPSTHLIEQELVQGWAQRVEEATDGMVTVTSYPGETLFGAAEIYDGVVEGAIDLGLSCFTYTQGRFPVMEVFELPGIIYESDKVASHVARDIIMDMDVPELQDTKLLMVLATGPGHIFSRVPIETLEDLQGLEIRTTGGDARKMELLGATPVAMPQSEGYEALARGVVQANLGPVEVLESFRQAEVTDYVTMTPFLYNILYYITINLDVWNSMTPEVQAAIEEVSEQVFTDIGAGLMDKLNDAGLEFAIEETGQDVITLTPEEQARWIERLEPIQDEWVEAMDARGFPGREKLDQVIELADYYNDEFH